MSVESKLAEISTEIKNLNKTVDEEKKSAKKDHDELTKLVGKVDNITERVSTLEKEKKEEHKAARLTLKQILFLIGGALVTAIIGGIISRMFQ